MISQQWFPPIQRTPTKFGHGDSPRADNSQISILWKLTV